MWIGKFRVGFFYSILVSHSYENVLQRGGTEWLHGISAKGTMNQGSLERNNYAGWNLQVVDEGCLLVGFE